MLRKTGNKPSKCASDCNGSGRVIIASGRTPWPHEIRAAEKLAAAGYSVEFLEEHLLPSADIRLNGIEYEIKSPETSKLSSVEQLIRKALKQAPNIIIDTSRCKIRDDKIYRYLLKKCREQKQIKRMLLIAKNGAVIDITASV